MYRVFLGFLMISSISIAGEKSFQVNKEVLSRYKKGAENVEPSLCCPTSYDPRYLKVIPQEIIEKDYGCGDPSKYVKAGERVLDLGSGGGKICYILSQKVGPKGFVIGVDFNDTMLALARKYKYEVAGIIGYSNVSFRKGRIQDLALDLEIVQKWLDNHPIKNVEDLYPFEEECERIKRESSLVASKTVDVIVSNCVLNLVRNVDKEKLFQEMYRVLKPGGSSVISDIVCDKDPTRAILNDPKLWSDCISGAFREDKFIAMFKRAGFRKIEILERQKNPWKIIDGVKFRSITVRAYKI